MRTPNSRLVINFRKHYNSYLLLPHPIMKKRNFFIVSVIILLIIIHGLSDNFFRVDSTTVLLLLILILLPFMPFVKKIKYGEFEAEITPEEVRKIEKKAEKIPEKKQKKLTSEKENIFKDLVDTDPSLALAKARIEIEKRIRYLSQIYLKEKDNNKFSLTGVVRDLSEEDVIDETLEGILVDVISVANRAIHGEFVSKDDAKRLVGISEKIIEELEYVVVNHALKSARIKSISKKDASEYLDAKYIVKTIVPYSRKPEMRIYNLNQIELDSFLEGYYDSAEYIISIEKRNKDRQN